MLNRPFTNVDETSRGKGGGMDWGMSLMREIYFLPFERSELDRK